MAIGVGIDAAPGSRSLIPVERGRRGEPAQVMLRFWRKLIFIAVAEAKKTHCGMPTDGAILARWWIAELRPERTDRVEWERSFSCACEMLSRDETVLRAELLKEIDKALRRANRVHVQSAIYLRRAMVLLRARVCPRRSPGSMRWGWWIGGILTMSPGWTMAISMRCTTSAR